MAKITPPPVIIITLLLLFVLTEVEAGDKKSCAAPNKNSTKLFVFGDSYVDTGNTGLNSPAYKPPYGITFPHKPSGRFSDGRVLTDYIASFLKIETPAPYALRNSSDLQDGINFAFGGTGVFNTQINGPNMSVQIDQFEKLIQEDVYTKSDLKSSFALVSVTTNDYVDVLGKNPNKLKWSFAGREKLKPEEMLELKEIQNFTTSIINQLSLNIKRIHSLGIKNIAVTALEPLGCLPHATAANSYQKCNENAINAVVLYHDNSLYRTLEELNKKGGKSINIVPLDIHGPFSMIIEDMQRKHDKDSTLMNPLEPCCKGVGPGSFCGSVDEKGAEKYTVCEKPELSFFWDLGHPSQSGWYQVFSSESFQHDLAYLLQDN